MHNAMTEQLRNILSKVLDPEVPVLSVLDLGIVRDAKVREDGEVDVVITTNLHWLPGDGYDISWYQDGTAGKWI
jgi:ring-1,2-phenylacetyl-CoA epoxidase subunit PaaD